MSQARVDSVENERGVTLTELVVTMALFGMIMVGVMGVWQKTQEAYFVGSDAAEVQQNVRTSLDFMVRELLATGRDATVCAFDYAGPDLSCSSGNKVANCKTKLGGGYTTCQGLYAIPQATPTLIQIRSDRNSNGTVANAGNGDDPDEDVTYTISAAAPCPAGETCIVRTDGAGTTTAMIAVDIRTPLFTYYPRPGYPPCDAVPPALPPYPCPAFVPVTQLDRDNIGKIGISVTATATVGGQTVNRTLSTDVVLRNRFWN